MFLHLGVYMCVIRRLSFDNQQSLGKSGKANELVRSCSTYSISSDGVVDTNVPTYEDRVHWTADENK